MPHHPPVASASVSSGSALADAVFQTVLSAFLLCGFLVSMSCSSTPCYSQLSIAVSVFQHRMQFFTAHAYPPVMFDEVPVAMYILYLFRYEVHVVSIV